MGSLDSCLVIYLLEGHPHWREPVAEALTAASGDRFGVSPLVKSERLVGAIRRGDPVLEQAYLDLFDRFVPLPMPEPVFLQAARRRAQFGLGTPDALHLACAQYHRCAALWTNNDRRARAAHGMARNTLASPTPGPGASTP